MSVQKMLFQVHTAMIEVLKSKKYDFAVHLVPIALSRSNLNIKETKLFVKFNKI